MTFTFNNFPSEFPEDGECDIIIMGAPTDGGSDRSAGQRDAPNRIREMDCWLSLHDRAFGHDLAELTVVDVGDCYVHPGDVELTNVNITSYVEEYQHRCGVFVTLGGDHSITPHILRGLRSRHHRPPFVIHLDAHADLGDHEDYDSCNHGSWVRYALDNGYASEVHTFGVRALGPAKEWYVKAPNAYQYPGTRWIWRVMDVCNRAAMLAMPVYLSVDLDVVDPAFAPGVVYPEPGGITSSELLNVVKTVCSNVDVIGVDIVEAVPSLDTRDLTLRLASRCVIAVMQGYMLGRMMATAKADVEERRGELRPVPDLKGEGPDMENKSYSPHESGVADETKSTDVYTDDESVEVGEPDTDEQEVEVEGGMARATGAAKAAGRGGKKAARGAKKSAKKTAKKAGKAAKGGARKTAKAAKAPAKKARGGAAKAVKPTARKAAKAPAKSAKKAAKKVAKKR